jgi:predicted small lipoprotein YifL
MFAYLTRKSTIFYQIFSSPNMQWMNRAGTLFSLSDKNNIMKKLASLLSLITFFAITACDNRNTNDGGYDKDQINSNTENMHLPDSSKMAEPDSATKGDNTVAGELKDTTGSSVPGNKY